MHDDSTHTSPPSPTALEQRRPWRVVVADGPDLAAIDWTLSLPIPGEAREAWTIGRVGGTSTVKGFDDQQMSRRHATFVPTAEGWGIRDAGSKNGVVLDGARIEADTTAPLSEGAVIRLGATLFVFERAPLSSASGAPAEGEARLVGRSAAHLAVLDHARTVAATDLPVLLLGETGTGKEVTTRHIHRLSGRRGELVAVSCAAIPGDLAESLFFGHKKGAFTGAGDATRGYFDAAQEGTLFLDEIGELPEPIQAKLLRVLESSEYLPLGATSFVKARVRVIAATNVDLREAVAHGTFRRDLYARLAAYPISLPPLRQRKIDIPLLLRAFIAAAAPEWSGHIEVSLVERLLLHDWPMNIRELQTVARQLMLRHREQPRLRGADLPDGLLRGAITASDEAVAAPAIREQVTADLLRRQLGELAGNVTEVARRLGRDRAQVYRWLKRWGIALDEFR